VEECEKQRKQRVAEAPAVANDGDDRRKESIVGKKRKKCGSIGCLVVFTLAEWAEWDGACVCV